MKNVKRKPNFYRLKYIDLRPQISDEYKMEYEVDNKKDIHFGETNILIKLNSINDTNFESLFETLENQKKEWTISKINGEAYLKINN